MRNKLESWLITLAIYTLVYPIAGFWCLVIWPVSYATWLMPGEGMAEAHPWLSYVRACCGVAALLFWWEIVLPGYLALAKEFWGGYVVSEEVND